MESLVKLNATTAEKSAWKMNDIMVPAYMVSMISEIDATAIEKLRAMARAQGDEPPTYTAIVTKAAAMMMKSHPEVNRAILGPPFFRSLYQFQTQDICVAVEKSLPFLPGLPFAEIIPAPMDQSLSNITKRLREAAACDETNNRQYRQFMRILRFVPRPFSLLLINLPYWISSLWPKYRGSAAWVNSPSKAGADFVLTTWPWPINFSFGIVKERPIVIAGKVEARKTIPLILVFDRRIMGGGPASRFFADYQALLAKADLVFGSEYQNSSLKVQA
jgi:hypothetical protein